MMNNNNNINNITKSKKLSLQNRNKTTLQNSPTHFEYLKIAITNVQTFSPTKHEFVADTFFDNNFHIFGLSETNTTERSGKHIFKSDEFSFFATAVEGTMGTGVALFIRKPLTNHITNVDYFMGRVIKIDFNFSGSKLRVIQLYLHANPKDKSERVKVSNHVISLIKQGKKDNFKIICMGDFNANFDIYNKNQRQGRTVKWTEKIYKDMEQLDMVDSASFIHNDDVLDTMYTFKNSQDYTSRIDLIWVDSMLSMELESNNVITPHLYSSDHNIVYTSFYPLNILGRSVSKHNRKKDKRVKFLYDQATTDNWDNFKARLDEKISIQNMVN